MKRACVLFLGWAACGGGPRSYTTETFTVGAAEPFEIVYDGHDFSRGEGWNVCCEEDVPATVTLSEIGSWDTDRAVDGDGFLIAGTLPSGTHTFQFGALCYVDGPDCYRWDFRVTIVAE